MPENMGQPLRIRRELLTAESSVIILTCLYCGSWRFGKNKCYYV